MIKKRSSPVHMPPTQPTSVQLSPVQPGYPSSVQKDSILSVQPKPTSAQSTPKKISSSATPIPSIPSKVKNIVEGDMPVAVQSEKIMDLLNEGAPISREVVRVLKEGLSSTKVFVADGQVLDGREDFDVRLKYAKFIAEVIGETKPDKNTGDFFMSVEEITSRSRRLIVMAQKVRKTG